MMIDWEKFRLEDQTGSIDLVAAYQYLVYDKLTIPQKNPKNAIGYLHLVQDLQPITSRQVAATVLATAIGMGDM